MDSRISERFSAFSSVRTEGNPFEMRGKAHAGSVMDNPPAISIRDESLGGMETVTSSPSASSNVRPLYSVGSGLSRNMEVNYLPPSQHVQGVGPGRGGLRTQRSGPIDSFGEQSNEHSILKRSISEVVEPITARQLHKMLHDLPEGKQVKKITRRSVCAT